MLRILFSSLSIFILLSCDKTSAVQSNSMPNLEIEYYDLKCIIDFEETEILGAHGFHTFLYKNGQIKSEGNLLNGIPNGFWKSYYDNGHLKSEGNYSNGQLNGFWKVYWYNGNIREEGLYYYCEKQGHWKFYYPTKNQQLHHEGQYSHGKQINQWKSYNELGVLHQDVQ